MKLPRNSFLRVLLPTGWLLVHLVSVGAVHAQTSVPDTLRLSDIRADAALHDPVSAQAALVEAASALRKRNLQVSRLPQLGLSGQATWQNEVPEIGFGGVTIDGPPLEQYRAQAELQWSIYDGGRSGRQHVAESARLLEQKAGVETVLQRLMDGASETFYAVLFQAAQLEVMDASANALAEKLAFMKVRVRDGAATVSDAAALEAEWLRVSQEAEQARVMHRAALDVLGAFVGRDIPTDAVLVPPDWSARLASALGRNEASAPEVVELRLRQERLLAEASAISAIRRPQVSLFGQAGLGRPSPFDFLNAEASPFALAGVRLQWSIMDWGQARRNREMIEAQAGLTGTALASTERRIERDLADDLALEAHLEARIKSDDRIVELRQAVVDATEKQLEAGAQLPAVYTERLAELTAAKAARERHRIERSRTQFRILSALGALESPPLDPESARDITRTGNQP